MPGSESKHPQSAIAESVPRELWYLIGAVTLISWLGFVAFVYVYANYGQSWVDGLSDKVGEVVAARAQQLARSGDDYAAMQTYREALDSEFDDPRQRVLAHQRYTRLLLDARQPGEAAAVMKAALALDPDDGWNYVLYAQALERAERPEQLLELSSRWFGHAEDVGKTRHTGLAYYYKGVALSALDQPEDALQAFKSAHEAHPDPSAALQAAELLHQFQQVDEARPYLEYVVEHGGGNKAERARELLASTQGG